MLRRNDKSTATEMDDNQDLPGKDMWKKDCEQQASGTAAEDRGGSTRETDETSGAWTMLYWLTATGMSKVVKWFKIRHVLRFCSNFALFQ